MFILKIKDKIIDIEIQSYTSLKDDYILFIYKYDPFIKEKAEDDFSKRLEAYVKKR